LHTAPFAPGRARYVRGRRGPPRTPAPAANNLQAQGPRPQPRARTRARLTTHPPVVVVDRVRRALLDVKLLGQRDSQPRDEARRVALEQQRRAQAAGADEAAGQASGAVDLAFREGGWGGQGRAARRGSGRGRAAPPPRWLGGRGVPPATVPCEGRDGRRCCSAPARPTWRSQCRPAGACRARRSGPPALGDGAGWGRSNLRRAGPGRQWEAPGPRLASPRPPHASGRGGRGSGMPAGTQHGAAHTDRGTRRGCHPAPVMS
jgi:hypothetical protein